MTRDHAPIGDSQFVYSSNIFLRRTIAFGLISISAIVLFVVLIPTMLVMITSGPGVFFYQTAFEQTSLDRRYKLEVRRRINFPANEFIDPSGTVSVQVIDLETSTLIDENTIPIHEYWGMRHPKIEWRQGTVAIREIENHNQTAFELKLHSQ